MSLQRILAASLAILVLVTGCSSSKPKVETSPLSKIQSEISYKLVLPANLPKGYDLETSEVLDVPGKKKTDVRLTFRGPGAAILTVDEAPYPIALGGEPVVRLEELGDVDVQYVNKGNVLLLTFMTDSGVSVKLMGIGVPEKDFLEIVKSMIRSQ